MRTQISVITAVICLLVRKVRTSGRQTQLAPTASSDAQASSGSGSRGGLPERGSSFTSFTPAKMYVVNGQVARPEDSVTASTVKVHCDGHPLHRYLVCPTKLSQLLTVSRSRVTAAKSRFPITPQARLSGYGNNW